jgi:ribose/xylose/arabinose/galactoside ABC-type transport system permease subunit
MHGVSDKRVSIATWARLSGVVLLAAAALATPGFLSAPSLLALLTTLSFVGCVAVAMTLITVSGNIMSFCLGATVAASSVLFVTVLNLAGLIPAMLAALAFGAVLTGAQGVVIGAFRANPIIVSIAALALIYGVAQAATGGGASYAAPGSGHEALKGRLLGLPSEFIAFLIVLLLAQFLLSFTAFGRHLVMVGSSSRAAEATGIRTWRTVAGAYVWAGLFAAVPGIMLAIRYGSANMEYGIGYDYDAIAAVLVGGTAIQGGQGSALRTFIGALVIAVVQVLLLLHGFRQEWQYLIAGVIVLAVIVLQGIGRRH